MAHLTPGFMLGSVVTLNGHGACEGGGGMPRLTPRKPMISLGQPRNDEKKILQTNLVRKTECDPPSHP